MSTRNWIAVGLTVVSLLLLVPGLQSDALTITASMPLLKKPLFEETQSILRAMADVFAVGVFIAFMAGNALDNLDAKLHPGYYYFVAYCLVSNIAFQCLYVPQPQLATLDIQNRS